MFVLPRVGGNTLGARAVDVMVSLRACVDLGPLGGRPAVGRPAVGRPAVGRAAAARTLRLPLGVAGDAIAHVVVLRRLLREDGGIPARSVAAVQMECYVRKDAELEVLRSTKRFGR